MKEIPRSIVALISYFLKHQVHVNFNNYAYGNLFNSDLATLLQWRKNLNVEKLLLYLNDHQNRLGYRDTFKSFCIHVSQVKGNLTVSLK